MSRNLRGSVTETSVISSVEYVFMNSEIINSYKFQYQSYISIEFRFHSFLITHSRENSWASLVAHWERIRLPVKETQVQLLVGKDAARSRATESAPQLLSLNLGACESQLLKPKHALQQIEACALHLESSPSSLQLEKILHSNEDPAQPNLNKNFLKKRTQKA